MLGSSIGRLENLQGVEKRSASPSAKRWSCYLVRCTLLSGSFGLQMLPSAFLLVLVVLRKELLLSLLYYITVEGGVGGLQNARGNDVRCQALLR